MVGVGVLHAERFARLGEQSPLLCRREIRQLLFLQPKHPRAQPVELIGARRGEERAHVPGRSLRGAVALHDVHGVAQAERRADKFIEINEHVGKRHRIGVAEMVLALHRAGDDAVKILYRRRHAHKPVSLELGEVDDGVAFFEPRAVFKAFDRDGVRKFDRVMRKVTVELTAGGFAERVHAAQHHGGERLTGAVAENDLRAPLAQKARELRGHDRMGRRRLLRLSRRAEIELYADAHAGLHPAKAADSVKRRKERGAHRFGCIIPAGDDG